MRLRRFTKVALLAAVGLVVLIAVVADGLCSSFDPSVQRTNGVVYGHRGDVDLALDVITPANPNGLGVLV